MPLSSVAIDDQQKSPANVEAILWPWAPLEWSLLREEKAASDEMKWNEMNEMK